MKRKYLDADRLLAAIEAQRQKMVNTLHESQEGSEIKIRVKGMHDAYVDSLGFIVSLQQEQPEVDLEKEIETYFKGWYMDETDQGYILHTPDDHAGLMSVKQVARHFYELGLNTRKEDK